MSGLALFLILKLTGSVSLSWWWVALLVVADMIGTPTERGAK
jgi:hypothetical protein